MATEKRDELIGHIQRPGRPTESVRIVTNQNTNREHLFWSFATPAGASGTYYFGGYYFWHGSSFTPAGGTNVGTANASYAAHAMVILGATSTDMVVRVTGTSINDRGTRTTTDFEDVDTSGGAANAYYETSKKFIGQVSYTLQSGTGVVINAGFSKYWDHGNEEFTVKALEATWLGGGNDATPNIELLHHKTTGWTYGSGGTATPPTAIASMNTDHNTEIQVRSGEPGAWKRTNLDQIIIGQGSEGVLWRVTTSANNTFRLGNLELSMEP